MVIKKVSPEYAHAYKAELSNFNFVVFISIGMIVLIVIPLLSIAILQQLAVGIFNSIFLSLLCAVLLLFGLKKRNKYMNDASNLNVAVSTGSITQKTPIQRGFIYYFKAAGSEGIEKIVIANHYGYDSWHLELKHFPLEVEIWRGLETKKILRIEIKDHNKVLDIIGKK